MAERSLEDAHAAQQESKGDGWGVHRFARAREYSSLILMLMLMLMAGSMLGLMVFGR